MSLGRHAHRREKHTSHKMRLWNLSRGCAFQQNANAAEMRPETLMRACELEASHSQPRTGGSAANNHGPQSCHLPHSQRRSFQSKRSAALQRPHPTAPGTHTVAGREKGQRRRPTREPVPTELGVRTPYAAASRLGAVPSRAWACWDAETRNKGRRPPTGQGAILRRARCIPMAGIACSNSGGTRCGVEIAGR